MPGFDEALEAYTRGEKPELDNWDLAIRDYAQGRFLPKPPRTLKKPMPPKQIIPMPKMPATNVFKPMGSALGPYVLHYLNEAPKIVKNEINGLVSKLAYPENLINETVKLHLSKQ